MLTDIRRGWNRDPSLKGRADLIMSELGWQYSENKGVIKVAAIGLTCFGIALSTHFHSAAVKDAATREMASRTGEVVIRTGGVERRGTILPGHAQMTTNDYPEANLALKAFSGAACKAVTLTVTDGRLHLPLWQHVGSSTVEHSTFTQEGFNRDAYACVPDAPKR